jgi:hypothetical protein
MHQLIDEILQTTGCFVHPYHSWERGLNESTNGPIGQFFFPSELTSAKLSTSIFARYKKNSTTARENVLAGTHPMRYFQPRKRALHYRVETAEDFYLVQ